MREIKFRAFIKEIKEIKIVSAIDWIKELVYFDWDNPDKDIRETMFYNFNEIELMQYTGLHDKNGREIYEGDIVKNINMIREVRFNEWSAEGYYGVMAWTIGDDTSFWQDDADRWEVINNIYENPNLLK